MSRGFSRDASAPASSKGLSSRRWLVIGGTVLGACAALGAVVAMSPHGLGLAARSSEPLVTQAAELNSKTLANFVYTTADDVQHYWRQDFELRSQAFTLADVKLHLTEEATSCGDTARSSGSFYCGTQRTAHFDLAFYRALQKRCPAEANLAEAYVVAHTLAHHVQTTLGLDAMVNEIVEKRKGPRHALGVRMDLQADCFAGVWARRSPTAEPLRPENFEDAQRCASEVATDGSPKVPAGSESFSHASTKQRLYWFLQGFRGGRIQECDTFAPAQP